jgi:hypothetical protein
VDYERQDPDLRDGVLMHNLEVAAAQSEITSHGQPRNFEQEIAERTENNKKNLCFLCSLLFKYSFPRIDFGTSARRDTVAKAAGGGAAGFLGRI